MAVRKLRAKILWVFLSVVLLLVLAVAALPLWFPWALRPIAKRYGATYAHYQRIGYARFELTDFALTNGATRVTANDVKAFVPTVWLWRHFNGGRNEDFLAVQSWKYAAAETKSVHANAPPSVRDIFQTVQNVAAALRDWVPTATLSSGAVLVDKQNVEIASANWTNGNLTAAVSLTNAPPLTIVASTKQGAPWTVTIASEPQSLHSTFSISERDGKLGVTGTVDWLTNRVELVAEFPPQGFIPETASARADSFAVPARLLGMPDYGDIGGTLRADWQTNRFKVQLAAKASPTTTNLPPLNVELSASGDANAAELDTVKISAPGLQAGLPAPVAIRFQPPFLSQPTTLNVAADLDQQHWFLAQGKLAGSAIVYPAEKFPRVSFTLTGSGITTASVTTSNLAIDGELNWPVLEVKSARVEMDDASRISLAGKYDFTEKVIRDGRLNSSGAFGGQFLPADYSFSSASITAQFAGPLNAMTNSAAVQVKHVIVPGVNPVDVEATWNGNGLNLNAAQVTLKTGQTSLLLRGSARFARETNSVDLTALELSESNRAELQLQQPVQIVFAGSSSNHSNFTTARASTNVGWHLNIGQLSLTGDDREFH